MSNTSESAETNVTFVTRGSIDNITNIVSYITRSVDEAVSTTSTPSHVTSDMESEEMTSMTTMISQTITQDFLTASYSPEYDAYDEYVYPGFSFEKPVYLYIWAILVIITSLVNIVVISILLREKMRNPTNIILTAIAISDSLAGLSTLPTYIMVYQSDEPPSENWDEYENYPSYPPLYNQDATVSGVGSIPNDASNSQEYEGYPLSKNLCRWFMVTKFFISKSFHSISIFLTLFLGIQRFVSVAAPFKAHTFTTERAILTCIMIAILSPTLHIYHLFDEKADLGLCEWSLEDGGCSGGCFELWFMFFIRNLIPCGILLLFTILFIRELHKGEVNIRRMNSSRGQIARRVVENRRIAVIVTSIVIVFLIPEFPYGFYLLFNAIDKTANNGVNMDLKTNRAIHMAYELLLVLSFHANFYIYTLFNRKFRIFLVKIFVQPVRRILGDTRRVSVSSTTFPKSSQKRTELYSMKSGLQTNSLQNTLPRPDTVESTMQSVSVDLTQTSNHDKNELEILNAND